MPDIELVALDLEWDVFVHGGRVFPCKEADPQMSKGLFSKKKPQEKDIVYYIKIVDEVRYIPVRRGADTGTFLEGLCKATGHPTSTWTEVSKALEVTTESAQEFLRRCWPEEAKSLDRG